MRRLSRLCCGPMRGRSLRGRALWRPLRRGGSALRMCALRRLALCPLRLQLLGLRGTLLDMGGGLGLHLLTSRREPSRTCDIRGRLLHLSLLWGTLEPAVMLCEQNSM